MLPLLPIFDLLLDGIRINILEFLKLSQYVLFLVIIVLQLLQQLVDFLFEICIYGRLSFLLVHP